MKERILLILSLLLITNVAVFAQTAARTVTNDDLDKFRQKRVQAEADYRANYQRLGMPSPEEMKKQEAERQAWLTEYAKAARIENRQSQAHFQAQANVLKAQIAGVQAQINYLRSRIKDQPDRDPVLVSPGQVLAVGILSGGSGYYRQIPGQFARTNAVNLQTPNVQAAKNAAAGAPNPYAGTALEQAGVKVVIGAAQPVVRQHRGYYNPFYYGGFPYTVAKNNSREDLVSQLLYLEQTKAGLLAQIEFLREEARQSGFRID